jgi:diguanylate cyclase (GGDEF)-like protein
MSSTKSLTAIQIERVVQHCHDGIVVFGKDGAVLLANPAAETMLGKGPLVGKKLELGGSVEDTLEVTLASDREVELRFSTIPWDDGIASMATLRDVTERRNAERRAQFMAAKFRIMNDRLSEAATVDPLTGLLNRRGIEEVLRREIRHARRTGSPLSALLMDCDDFKQVNDAHGYTTGDAVLVELARRVHSSTRTTDHLARVGGDEFLVLLPATPEGIAEQMGERIRAVASGPLPNRTEVRITCSISLAQIPNDVTSLEALIALLQGGVQRSKALGKNRVTGGSHERDVPGLEQILATPSSFRVVATPIVDLHAGMHAIGYQLQPRLEVDGLESPALFLRAAEQQHARTVCDLAAFERCLQHADGLDTNTLCLVDIDPGTILEVAQTAMLETLIAKRSARHARLCLNLRLDAILSSDPNRVVEPLDRLRTCGASFAVRFQGLALDALVAVRPEVVIFGRSDVQGALLSGPEGDRHRIALDLVRSVGAQPMAEDIDIHSELVLVRELGLPLATGHVFDSGVRRSTA